MNPLDQYLQLYREHGDILRAHSPQALNARRQAAFDTLQRLGRLPAKGDEGYAKIAVDEMFAPDYGVNIARVPMTAGAETAYNCAVSHIGAFTAMLVNDAFVGGKGLEESLPDGVEVMSLARAAELYPTLVDGNTAPADSAVAALNSLLVQDGVFIRVRSGVQLSRPIQILCTFNSSQPVLAPRRIRVIVEDGASASVLVCDHPKSAESVTMNCRVVELTVGAGATLNFYDLEEATANSRRASVLASEQAAGSNLCVTSTFISGGQTRNEYYITHQGEHCSTELGGLVIGGGAQVIDNAVSLIHSAPRCKSRQLFKYALFDSAQGAFEGMVTVQPGAEFTDARQTNRNLLASPDARMHAMPQLIIYCDEVKASHGATTGRLDEDALFYMRSRGIPEQEARMMLTNAFLTDVLDMISLEPLRDRLRLLVDNRLRGCEAACSKCSAR